MSTPVEPEHRHYFARAVVRDAHGVPMPDGRRCVCGVEIVGSPFGVNAAVIRAGQRFNEALADVAVIFARRLEAAQRGYREP